MEAGDTRQSQSEEIGRLNAPIVLAHEPAFRIGDVEFRPATREVSYDGHTTVIEPRVMQLLIALHRAGGKVVNKDDLLQSCWESRIVGEDAINRVVSRLRSLAENGAGRQFRVETITKVGYRLVPLGGGTPTAVADAPAATRQVAQRPAAFFVRRRLAIAAAGLLLVLVAAGTWLWLRPPVGSAHSMMVRLSGFKPLSADLPANLQESIGAEVTAAFNVDGIVGISMASDGAATPAPTYALGGTIYRVGDSIRVITRFANLRSGAVLWSDSVDYGADQVAKVPHKIAVDAATVIRCGLSGAATYRKPLPDPVLSNYMQYCQEYWAYGGSKTLRFAKLVVAAVPDFSWGWSAVGNGYVQAAGAEHDGQVVEALRAAGRAAEDKAVALDPNNSEALSHKAYLIDRRDWLAQEALFKRAIAAKPLDCGCEHYGYGLKLESVGRLGAAIEQYRAATDMLALWPDSQHALAGALVAAERGDQAKPYFSAAIDLSKDPNFDKWIAISEGTETGDFAAAISALSNTRLPLDDESRAALLAGYEVLAGRDAQARPEAIRGLLALPKDKQIGVVATMLGALGANREALLVAGERPWLFWHRSMRGVLNEPGFPAAAKQYGLMRYWKESRTKPDICLSGSAPAFCRMI